MMPPFSIAENGAPRSEGRLGWGVKHVAATRYGLLANGGRRREQDGPPAGQVRGWRRATTRQATVLERIGRPIRWW
jgi:hypothetical protein